MANPKSKAPKKKKGPDALVASRDVTLTEEELSKASGGAADIFAKIGDIKGESIDDKHKDEIEVLSRGPRLPGGRTFR
jgi:type VI protein secretion system component Hcp